MKMHEQSRYRIYTEDKNRGEVQKIVADCFDSFMIFTSFGIWKNESENSLVIEIITADRADVAIANICHAIKYINKQNCCLVTIEPVEIAYV